MFVKAPRRVPAQKRSRERVERILEAAAQIFADDGYEAATMEGIAARAETSIGSIYQFFPNKPAVFSALLTVHRQRVRDVFAAILAPDGPLLAMEWPDFLDAGIDALAAFTVSDPGYRAVWMSIGAPHLTDELFVEGEAMNREFAKRIATILDAKLTIPPEKLAMTAAMVVEIATVMLVVASRREGQRQGFIDETKVLIGRYLAPYGKRARMGESSNPGVRSRR